MAVVVLWVGRSGTALVVVVMVVAVSIAEMTSTVVVVVCYCSIVVGVLGGACHGSRDGGSVTVLNCIQGGRGGPSSPNDPNSSVDSCSILSLLQSAEARRLVLLMLRAPMTSSSRWSLKSTWRKPTISG